MTEIRVIHVVPTCRYNEGTYKLLGAELSRWVKARDDVAKADSEAILALLAGEPPNPRGLNSGGTMYIGPIPEGISDDPLAALSELLDREQRAKSVQLQMRVDDTSDLKTWQQTIAASLRERIPAEWVSDITIQGESWTKFA
jgi:hypothetical protein